VRKPVNLPRSHCPCSATVPLPLHWQWQWQCVQWQWQWQCGSATAGLYRYPVSERPVSRIPYSESGILIRARLTATQVGGYKGEAVKQVNKSKIQLRAPHFYAQGRVGKAERTSSTILCNSSSSSRCCCCTLSEGACGGACGGAASAGAGRGGGEGGEEGGGA